MWHSCAYIFNLSWYLNHHTVGNESISHRKLLYLKNEEPEYRSQKGITLKVIRKIWKRNNCISYSPSNNLLTNPWRIQPKQLLGKKKKNSMKLVCWIWQLLWRKECTPFFFSFKERKIKQAKWSQRTAVESRVYQDIMNDI